MRAFSPDGFVFDQETGELSTLEIKFPISLKDASTVDGNKYLEQNKEHYAQVQFQLFTTGLNLSHYFVYTPKAVSLIRIQRNDQYL